jgi:DNA-directed RNA polymerase II subunit RPB1
LTVENTKNFILVSGICQKDTFHSAGIGAMGTATLGVPRIKEILSLSRKQKTPIMSIYLTKEHRANKIMANRIASYIKYTTIGDLVKKIDIYYDPTPRAKGGYMDRDGVNKLFYSQSASKLACQSNIDSMPFLVRLTMNREQMLEKGVTLLDIKIKFCDRWEKRYVDTKGTKKEEKDIIDKVNQCAVLSNDDNSEKPMIHIRLDMNEFDMNTLIGFQEIIVNKFTLKGIKGIDGIINIQETNYISYDNDDELETKEKQHIIYTNGVNMKEIRYLKNIDLNKTISNNIVDIYHTFGIEAARVALLKEISLVLGDKKPNYQHLSILVDVMTCNGFMTQIDRHGINRTDADPLARATFEKSVEQLKTAAVFSQVDHVKSVSTSIMVGKAFRGGTSSFTTLLDTDLLEKSEVVEVDIATGHIDIGEVVETPLFDDILGRDEMSGMIPM